MKFVFKHADGTYMSRSWNYLTRDNRTEDLQEARVFNNRGAAKNAARVAAAIGTVVPIGLVVQELPL